MENKKFENVSDDVIKALNAKAESEATVIKATLGFMIFLSFAIAALIIFVMMSSSTLFDDYRQTQRELINYFTSTDITVYDVENDSGDGTLNSIIDSKGVIINGQTESEGNENKTEEPKAENDNIQSEN